METETRVVMHMVTALARALDTSGVMPLQAFIDELRVAAVAAPPEEGETIGAYADLMSKMQASRQLS